MQKRFDPYMKHNIEEPKMVPGDMKLSARTKLRCTVTMKDAPKDAEGKNIITFQNGKSEFSKKMEVTEEYVVEKGQFVILSDGEHKKLMEDTKVTLIYTKLHNENKDNNILFAPKSHVDCFTYVNKDKTKSTMDHILNNCFNLTYKEKVGVIFMFYKNIFFADHDDIEPTLAKVFYNEKLQSIEVDEAQFVHQDIFKKFSKFQEKVLLTKKDELVKAFTTGEETTAVIEFETFCERSFVKQVPL